MHKLLTKEQLEDLSTISDEVKSMINEIIQDEVGVAEEARILALRGYLISLYLETDYAGKPHDEIRCDLSESAAAFSDGWSYCMEYGVS